MGIRGNIRRDPKRRILRAEDIVLILVLGDDTAAVQLDRRDLATVELIS